MKFNLSFCLVLVSFTMGAATADVDDMKLWDRPCVVDWSGTTLTLGGIRPQQLQHLFVWSMDDSDLLWYVKCRRRQDYTKESRTNTVTCSYGEILAEWRQKFPKNEQPRAIRNGEVLCVSLSWAFPYMLGIRSETEYFYYVKSGDVYERLLPDNGRVGGRDVTEFLNRQARVINDLRFGQGRFK